MSHTKRFGGKFVTPNRADLIDWIRAHAIQLNTLNPDASLDDLEPLREIVGDARIVALGENSHFIREFCLLRHRVLRFLVERCGFTVHALEFGYSEGFRMDGWLQGEGEDAELEGRLGPFPYPKELRASLHWLRNHNRNAPTPVGFAGIDIARAGGSLLPDVEALAEFLPQADPEALPLLETVRVLAERIHGDSMAASAPLHTRLSSAEKDALSASLSRLSYRLAALAPQHVARFGHKRYARAHQHLRSACHADYNLQAMTGFIAGNGLSGDMGARESYMAESVRWHFQQAPRGSKIALVAHNAHIQKAPVIYDGVLSAIPMGQHLAQAFGSSYVSLALTSAGGNTAGLYPDEGSLYGFKVVKEPLAPTPQGSIEATLGAAGVDLGVVGWRDAPRPDEAPDCIRYDTDFMQIPVLDAFDGMFQVPVSTVAEDIGV